jgi:exonuclease III
VKVVTFNVNGVNGRLPRLLEWLDAARPDIVCLQEIKTTDVKCPTGVLEDAGYGSLWHGQRSGRGARGSGQLYQELLTYVVRYAAHDGNMVRIREPAELRCCRCSAPYQIAIRGVDAPLAVVMVRCPTCGSEGRAALDSELAKRRHLIRAGSAEARTYYRAVLAACSEAAVTGSD